MFLCFKQICKNFYLVLTQIQFYNQPGVIPFFNYQYQKMEQKISLIESLKNTGNHQLDHFQVFLVIINSKSVTLYECRRFMFHKYASLVYEWKQLPNQQLLSVGQQCKKYISSNRSTWDKQYEVNIKNVNQFYKMYNKIRKGVEFDKHLAKPALVDELKKYYHKQNSADTTGTKDSVSNRELGEFINLIQDIYQHELQEQKYSNPKDSAFNQVVSQLMLQYSITSKTIERKQDLKQIKIIQNEMSKIKTIVQSIFMHYCIKDNKDKEEFGRPSIISPTMQLSLYIKLFEHLKLQSPGQHFSKDQLTRLFQKYKKDDQDLSFQQFWSICKILYEIDDQLVSTKKEEAPLEPDKIEAKKRYNLQIEKIKKLKNMLNEELISLKKGVSSTKINKSHSMKLPKLSLFNQQRSIPQKYKQQKSRNNFIQQIRQQIANQQSLQNSLVKGSYFSPPKHEHIVGSSLPKILKIPNDKIESQGIYQSLKRFATFDYLSQQKKIKNMIGLSIGDDEEYMKAYFKRQSKAKQQKEASLNIVRQQRRKKALQSLSKNQPICKKDHLSEVEPYMRF